MMKCYFEASGIRVLGLGMTPMGVKVQHNSLYSEIQGNRTCTLEVSHEASNSSVFNDMCGMVKKLSL